MGALDQPISDAVPRDLRNTLTESLWGVESIQTPLFNGEADSQPRLDAYFEYYGRQCSLIALFESGQHVSVKTYQDIVTVLHYLRLPWTKEEIQLAMIQKDEEVKDPDRLNMSINLAARLLLMVEFGNLPYAFSGRRQLQWSHGTMRGFLEEHFCTKPVLGHEHVKFEKNFIARKFARVAGIELEWTNNLADHLRMVDDDTKVTIFHHASFLEYQQDSLLPAGLVDETLRTLALLFPQSDRKTRLWFNKAASSHHLDARVVRCGHLRADDRQIENFMFWHDRLVILKQVFDEARPSTLPRWWHDRRNGVQWYTFWVAVLVLALTIFFGVVQSVEGALQVYKAYHPSR